MEVVDAAEVPVANAEALEFLREQRPQLVHSHRRKTGSVATLILETLNSLEQTPCATQTEDDLKQFYREMSPFALTTSELLMLANHCPSTPVELHLMIADSEERIGDEGAQRVLEIVARVLRKEEIVEEEEEEELAEADEEDNGVADKEEQQEEKVEKEN